MKKLNERQLSNKILWNAVKGNWLLLPTNIFYCFFMWGSVPKMDWSEENFSGAITLVIIISVGIAIINFFLLSTNSRKS